MSTGGTTNKERARAQSRQALRVIEEFFFTIKFSLKFQSIIYPNSGGRVLENGFSIETGGWDLICNQFSISWRYY